MIEPIPLHRLNLQELTVNQMLRRVIAIVDRSGLQAGVERALTKAIGRPRLLPPQALLVLIVMQGLARGQMHMTKINALIVSLTQASVCGLGCLCVIAKRPPPLGRVIGKTRFPIAHTTASGTRSHV